MDMDLDGLGEFNGAGERPDSGGGAAAEFLEAMATGGAPSGATTRGSAGSGGEATGRGGASSGAGGASAWMAVEEDEEEEEGLVVSGGARTRGGRGARARDVSDTTPTTPGSPDVGLRAISSGSPRKVIVTKAQEVVSNMIAKGSSIKQDVVNKAKEFDEKHRLTANASKKVISFDKRVGLTEKFNVGIAVVNNKVKSVDERLQVLDKTMAALLTTDMKLSNMGSAVK